VGRACPALAEQIAADEARDARDRYPAVHLREDVRHVFDLLGEHDMASEPELRAALNEALEDGRGIVVDLSKAEFIDSSVIKTLLDTRRDLAAQGRELATEVNAASIVMRVLEITQFRAAVATVGTRDAAVAIARA
jgi:anti-anti-sigma factor